MVPFIHAYTVDVRSGMRCERAKYPVGQGDALADRFVVSVMDGGTPVDLKGVGVVATVVRPDGLTVPLKGTIENGTACVTLEDKCYDVGGNITVTVSLEAGEMRQSVLQVALNVATGETDMIAETAVLNVADVLAAAERAEAAADRAESAGGGSGGGLPTGGAAHQQLVTDADGNALWEDRTHYAEAVNAEVIPETEWVNNEGQFVLVEAPTNQPVIGVNHTVVYNGVSYDCVGVAYEADGIVAVALGNTYMIDGEVTEHPFFMAFLPPEVAAGEGVYGICLPIDGAESVTTSITLNGEVVHPLDEKYIPDSVMTKKLNLINGSASGSVRSTDAAEETDDYTIGENAFVFGLAAKAHGYHSIAIGNTAYVGNVGGNSSFVDSHDSGVAIGNYAQADRNGLAIGVRATAAGYDGVAIGVYAETDSGVAIGTRAEAASAAVALGYDCVAKGEKQTALGCNNIEDADGKYAFILGNGRKVVEDPEMGNYWPRSNAHTVDWDGNAWFAGDVYIGGTSQDDARKLATVEDVLAALPTWNGGAY